MKVKPMVARVLVDSKPSKKRRNCARDMEKRKHKGNPVMETFVREHMLGLVKAALKAGLEPWTIIRLSDEGVKAAIGAHLSRDSVQTR